MKSSDGATTSQDDGTQSDPDEDDCVDDFGTSRQTPGRPPRGGMAMTEAELAQRRNDLRRKRRSEELTEREEEELSDKRKMASNMRWSAEKKTQSERRFVKVTNDTWKKAHAAFEVLLPKEDDINERMLLFSKIVGEVPSDKVTCTKHQTPNRAGKSSFYERYKRVKSFLEDRCSDAMVEKIVMHYCQKLASQNYEFFRETGLTFLNEDDIPLSALAQDMAKDMEKTIFHNRRHDVRKLHHEAAIKLYKVRDCCISAFLQGH